MQRSSIAHEIGKLPDVSRRLARWHMELPRDSELRSPTPITQRSPQTGRATASRGRATISRSAKLIVAFGADFLDGGAQSVPQQLDFADARAKIENAPRLVYVGARRSLTGLNADQWINARPGSELAIVALLAGSSDAAAGCAGKRRRRRGPHRVCNASSPRQSRVLFSPAAVTPMELSLCLAANALNQSQGNVGTTVKPGEAITDFEGIDSPSQLRALAQRMQAGAVPMLMVRGANPAYTMPKSSGFAAAMAKVPFKVSFSSVPDETTCDGRSRFCPIITRSSSGVMQSRCAGRSRCSSRRWIRCSTRAPLRMFCCRSRILRLQAQLSNRGAHIVAHHR